MKNKEEIKEILEALIELNNLSKILDTFIPAFENSTERDGYHYLHGNFNLGSVKTGRMSSSGPNLQNIPSTGSKYAKSIKHCFQAKDGWLFVGADFNALEARIGALVTGDPEKQKVYTDGYDSHCMMAYTYWPEKMPDITPNKESINSIKSKYPDLRQASKTVSFALQYGGTAHTLVKNSGFSNEEAEAIVERYNALYKVSKEWEQRLLTKATNEGYVECAFGLKLRTPILSRCILNKKSTPKLAQAESRTAINAAQQSYGLLNNRANFAFMEKVYNSPYAEDILPSAQIHDSGYYIVRNNPEVVKFVNDNLISEMEWQELEPIKHSVIALGGELEIYYPSWAEPTIVPNNASLSDIKIILENL